MERVSTCSEYKQRGWAFACDAAAKTHQAQGARETGYDGRFDQPLKIDGEIVGLRTQFAEARHQSGAVAAERDDAIEKRIVFEQRHPPRLDHPSDAGIGKAGAKRRGGGKRVDDVAHRAHPNDQNAANGFAGFGHERSTRRGGVDPLRRDERPALGLPRE